MTCKWVWFIVAQCKLKFNTFYSRYVWRVGICSYTPRISNYKFMHALRVCLFTTTNIHLHGFGNNSNLFKLCLILPFAYENKTGQNLTHTKNLNTNRDELLSDFRLHWSFCIVSIYFNAITWRVFRTEPCMDRVFQNKIPSCNYIDECDESWLNYWLNEKMIE